MPNVVLKCYLGGALFNLKELVGNALLAEMISTESGGRYECILPQDLEADSSRSSTLRDADLLAVLSADVALFNFDGADLDSGTVVEFMFAKFADIPSVILRSDFRRGGDNHADSWNLMLSDYPRTKQVIVHAMSAYHHHKNASGGSVSAAKSATIATARRVVEALDEVRTVRPVLSADLREPVYRWLSILPDLKSVPQSGAALAEFLNRKVEKKLL